MSFRKSMRTALKFGDFTMGGIGTATFGAIILYQILAWDRSKE
jgi:putative pyrimidine permease RutG